MKQEISRQFCSVFFPLLTWLSLGTLYPSQCEWNGVCCTAWMLSVGDEMFKSPKPSPFHTHKNIGPNKMLILNSNPRSDEQNDQEAIDKF